MSLRAIFALMRASFRTATSYRLRFLQSMGTSILTVVPVFFVARALQPMMEKSIQNEGREYFSFLIVGFVVVSIVAVCVDSLPSQVGADINNGFFEALLGTPAGAPSVLSGLVAYPVSFTLTRGLVMLVLGAFFGVHIAWMRVPETLLIVALLIVAHFGVALMATASVIAFRTTLSIPQLVIAASGFLGGVYWPTSVIPSWVHVVSEALPISYGLRALRRTLLDGRPLSAVSDDLLTLAGYGGLLLTLGVIAMSVALSYARRRGTLSQY